MGNSQQIDRPQVNSDTCTMKAILILFLSLILSVGAMIDCTDILSTSTSTFGGLCNNKWKNVKPHLRPTQPQVGYAWIQRKLESDYTTAADAQQTMNSGNVPVVIGPGPALYIVDDHHSLCALDFSGFDETSVTFDVLCDMRHLTPNDFWNELQGQNLAFLVAHPYNDSMELPKAISFQDIPSYFAFTATDKSLSDDPWRSVAGFSRKVKVAAPPAPKCDSTSSEYCERCMYRGCVDGYQKEGAGVAFFEFRWGYLFNDATYYSTNLWPSESERQSFLKIFEALGHEEVGKMDMSAWMDAASHVVNLCRSESLSKYQLDTKLFPGTSSLPGYMATYQPLPDDPVCNSPTCKWGRDR